MAEVVPLVSICCIAYNQQNYIEETIQGFLIQKTNFAIEIIIHDDASTDDTAKIINEYAAKHPNLILTIFQKINQYSKGIKPWPNFVFPKARGKYIALCEGDDYWTDPLKLQNQVDFLEKNNGYGGVAENAKVLYDSGKLADFGIKKSRALRMEEIISCRQFATASLVFRNNNEFPESFNNLVVGDTPLVVLIQSKAPIYYNNKTSSVYRRGQQGVTASFNSPRITYRLINLNNFLNEFTEHKHRKIFERKIERLKATLPGRKVNIIKKILLYIPTYWEDIREYLSKNSDFELHLIENLVCLPIDQRYEEKDMLYIINSFKSFLDE
jgi:glycosyltransferase involved in cell wall biosynthesis